jgi:hypothetical protein
MKLLRKTFMVAIIRGNVIIIWLNDMRQANGWFKTLIRTGHEISI